MSEQTISNLLKQLRKTSGLAANEVAEKLKKYNIDISYRTLYGYESGLSMPNADVFVALCRIYKCDNPMDIFGGFSLSPSETDIVEKYRNLDNHGRKMVDSVLSHESDRVKALEDQARKILELQRAIIPRYIMAYYEKMASAGSGEYLFDDIPTDLIEVPDCPMAHNADFVIGVTGRSMEPTYCDGDKVYVKKMAEIPTGSIGIFVRGNECFIKELGVDRLISHNKKYPDIPASDDIRLVGKVLGKVEES